MQLDPHFRFPVFAGEPLEQWFGQQQDVAFPDGVPYLLLPVLVSLTPHLKQLDRKAPRLPAVIDTGSNGGLSIRRSTVLAKLTTHDPSASQEFLFPKGYLQSPSGYDRVRYANDQKLQPDRVPLYDGVLWIHSATENHPPLRLPLGRGFRCRKQGGPQLPLVGSAALFENNIAVFVDYSVPEFYLIQQSDHGRGSPNTE